MADPTTLTMAAFLALAGQCGEGIAPTTLAQLTHIESSMNPLAININAKNGKGGGTVKGIKTKTQAIAYAKELRRNKINFDAGITQINSANFNWLEVNEEKIFDPCHAISAQARLLKSYSKYNTGSEKRGFDNGYVEKAHKAGPIVRALIGSAVAAEPSPSVPRETLAPPAAPTNCPLAPAWDVGGSLRLECAKPATTPKQPPTKSKPVTRKMVIEEYP